MRLHGLALLALALGGCATTPPSDAPRHLFADHLFPAYHQPLPEDLFALSAEMREFAELRVKSAYRNHASLDALKDELRVEYEAAVTTPAALTFASRSGNCLSLVILTAAFAKHLGVPFRYQSVFGLDTWHRAGDLAFRSGHVNLRLGGLHADGRTIDFLASDNAPRRFTLPLAEHTVVAMYRNNRAAEALVDGQVEAAYWWARSAIEAAPEFVPAYNTLGVVYQRHGNGAEAERVLRHALAREPENVQILGNLANVLERAGRKAEGRALRAALARVDPHPPFHFLDRGLAALERGEPRVARGLFERELRRMPFNEEVHFALARADERLGDLEEAQHHLALAAEYSTTRDRRNLYGAKLATLKALAN